MGRSNRDAYSLWLILYRDEASDVNLRIELRWKIKSGFRAAFRRARIAWAWPARAAWRLNPMRRRPEARA